MSDNNWPSDVRQLSSFALRRITKVRVHIHDEMTHINPKLSSQISVLIKPLGGSHRRSPPPRLSLTQLRVSFSASESVMVPLGVAHSTDCLWVSRLHSLHKEIVTLFAVTIHRDKAIISRTSHILDSMKLDTFSTLFFASSLKRSQTPPTLREFISLIRKIFSKILFQIFSKTLFKIFSKILFKSTFQNFI